MVAYVAYDPELIQTMRAALDTVASKIPNATPEMKTHLAAVILKAAATGQTTFDGLVASASDQIQSVISMVI